MSGVKGMRRYDPLDYKEELERLAKEGMTTKDFISRSNPSRRWFTARVQPITEVALCHGCGKYFNPQLVGSLQECERPRCSISLDRRNS